MSDIQIFDISNINIKKDSQQATDVGALAFTQGDSVHFAPGQFKPETKKGQELIGHEFAHVVQQREGKVKANKQIGKFPINDNKNLEKQADEQGKKAADGVLDEESSEPTPTDYYDIKTGEHIEHVIDGSNLIVAIDKTEYKALSTIFSISNITLDPEIRAYNFYVYIMKHSKTARDTGMTKEELNIRAFLSTIRSTENAGHKPLEYNVQYGGGTFTNLKYDKDDPKAVKAYSKHPNKKIKKWGQTSSAAGAYQFLGGKKYWGSLDLPDFTPISQDKGVLIIITKRNNTKKSKGVVEDIKTGNILSAANKLNGIWTSLPGGKQEAINENEFMSKFKANLINELNGNSIIYTPVGELKF